METLESALKLIAAALTLLATIIAIIIKIKKTPLTFNEIDNQKDYKEEKKKCKILIIDDKEKEIFSPEMRTIFRNQDFDITFIDDLYLNFPIHNYNLIYVDYNGVGKSKFGGSGTGENILADISENGININQFLVLFSDKTNFSLEMLGMSTLIDGSMKKPDSYENDTINYYTRHFKTHIKLWYNSERRWKKIRALLEDKNIESKKITDIENEYRIALSEKSLEKRKLKIKKLSSNFAKSIKNDGHKSRDLIEITKSLAEII